MTKIKTFISGLLGSDRFDRWMRIYIHNRNLYNKGQCELNFVRSLAPLQPLMVLWLFLKSILGDIPNWLVYVGIPVIVVGKAAIHWCLGYLWEEHGVFDKEADWVNDRNEAMRKINNGKVSVARKQRKR